MRGRPFRVNKKRRLANGLIRGRGGGEEKELAPFLTRPFKRLSSRLSSSGLIRLLLVSWKSRIKDQGSVENISNKLPLRDSGFPGKAGSRIVDQGSRIMILDPVSRKPVVTTTFAF